MLLQKNDINERAFFLTLIDHLLSEFVAMLLHNDDLAMQTVESTSLDRFIRGEPNDERLLCRRSYQTFCLFVPHRDWERHMTSQPQPF